VHAAAAVRHCWRLTRIPAPSRACSASPAEVHGQFDDSRYRLSLAPPPGRGSSRCFGRFFFDKGEGYPIDPFATRISLIPIGGPILIAREPSIRASEPSGAVNTIMALLTKKLRPEWPLRAFLRQPALYSMPCCYWKPSIDIAGRQQKVAMVETEHQNIAQLILPGGAPIWFDVKKAEGPIRTTPFERQDGVRSAMMLAGRQQYLSSSPPPK
jgi:hypothetical protein